MAPDLKTFVALQTYSTTPGSDYIPRDDEAEAALYDNTGVGEMRILTPSEIQEYALQDFGLSVDR
jgi:hypothetical protein